MMAELDGQDIVQETPIENVFIPPSVNEDEILNGSSYTYHSPVPEVIFSNPNAACVLGVDEAGRGPVLGPMVYGILYLPIALHHSLLAETHHFNDSKVLAPAARSHLLRTLCTPGTDLFKSCGWATQALSAREIAAGMLKANVAYNLNAQAMDATINLIRETIHRVNIAEVYVDTIGSPTVYQRKLERIFPTLTITVAKKADSLYPCVSAASVCAKVTRDAALEVSYRPYATSSAKSAPIEWGSGYPSDARCTEWLKTKMDPFFGWGAECRFSWGTAKELLDKRELAVRHDWPRLAQDYAGGMSDFLVPRGEEPDGLDDLATWFGKPVPEDVL